jgi:predicted DNA-binding transcriptional regulator YafY
MDSAGPADQNGWVQVVLPIEPIKHAHHDLLSFRADAEVVTPPDLRERMVETMQPLAAIYRDRYPIMGY